MPENIDLDDPGLAFIFTSSAEKNSDDMSAFAVVNVAADDGGDETVAASEKAAAGVSEDGDRDWLESNDVGLVGNGATPNEVQSDVGLG